MTDFVHQLATISWTLYGIGIALIAARIVSRRLRLGAWKKLQIEDGIILFVAVTFTIDFWCINQVAENGSNFMSPETAAALTPEGVRQTVYGSKLTLVLEMFTLATIWLCKGCILLMCHRITNGLPQLNRAVKYIAVYCVFAYLMIVTFFLAVWCRPIYEYWAVPVRHSQCASYYNHMIFATAFNILADLLILWIPIPIIIKVQLPLKRKLILCCVLCLGVFNILTAILNRYYNFSNPNSTKYVIWYAGEVATGVYVANVPHCWPLLQRTFRLDSWSQNSQKSGGRSASAGAMQSKSLYSGSRGSAYPGTQPRKTRMSRDDAVLAASESEERITGGKQSEEDNVVELTPVWHHSANSTIVNGLGSGEKERGGRPENEGGRGITKTIEVDISRSL